MPRYKLIIEYDGAPFAGWQIQADGLTVQGVLTAAIEALSGEHTLPQGAGPHRPHSTSNIDGARLRLASPTRQLDRAGRVDRGSLRRAKKPLFKGPGARILGCMPGARCAHVDLTKDWDTDTIRDALNAHIRPHPMAILAAEHVAEDFNARTSAIKRHYLYRIINRRADLTVDAGHAWRVPRPLDAAAMHAAAQRLVGKHDFTTFRSTECQAASPVKTLDRLDVERHGDDVNVWASARSFLHSQVRSMVGSLVMVGEGKWSADDLRQGARRARPHRLRPGRAAGRALFDEGGLLAEILVDDLPVNRRQRAQVGDRHALVDLMHGLPDQAEFHHRAISRDETRIGRAAGGRQFRLAAGHLGDRIRHQFGERAGLGDEHAGVRRLPLQRKFYFAAGRLGRALLDQFLQRVERVLVVEANVETRARLAGNEIDGLVADIDRGEFQMRGRELRAAGVERLGLQRGDQRHQPRIGLSARCG